MNFIKKVYKKIRHYFVVMFIKLSEKKFIYKEHTIKYIFQNNKADKLCVVFSGFPEQGKKAEYNYKRTLYNQKGFNYLFILDDMVDIPTGGSYYLGASGDYWGLEAIPELINMIKNKCKSKILVTVGSSKGGTSALLWGGKVEADYIIAGACQYKIGTYLLNPYHRNSLIGLLGKTEATFEDIEYLDSLCFSSLMQNRKNTKIYLHFSDNEDTYTKHIKYLVEDIEKLGYFVSYDIMHYENHGDVGIYFPKYLLKILAAINGN